MTGSVCCCALAANGSVAAEAGAITLMNVACALNPPGKSNGLFFKSYQIGKRREGPYVRFGSNAEMCSERIFRYSLNHLIGTRQHGWWHCEAQCLRGFEIDHQLVLGRRLNRQVGGFFTL